MAIQNGQRVRPYSPKKSLRTGPCVAREVYRCSHPGCYFWSRFVSLFHDHLLFDHKSTPSFKCSACTLTGKDRSTIFNHLYTLRRKDGPYYGKNHLSARVICTVPIPKHRYSDHLRCLSVPGDLAKGYLDGGATLAAVPQDSGASEPTPRSSDVKNEAVGMTTK